jgi:alkanesulfonate monooxygenase SsuD/methylene tetrahydromethanopterin reductase-like flavin-dependent oxidoreductase (luciferase family)
MYTKPGAPIPLLCAANGPIMARNAGRHTGGYVAVGVPPEYHRDVLIPAFERGARESDKDPSTLMKCAWVSTSYHPDAEKALAGARVYGGLLIPECYHYVQDPRIIEQRALLVRDEALRAAFCIATSGEEIASTYQRFIDAGCNHIIWADMSPDPSLVADVWEQSALPQLSRQAEPTAARV